PSAVLLFYYLFFFSSRRRHTRFSRDWSSDVCSSDLAHPTRCSFKPRPPRVTVYTRHQKRELLARSLSCFQILFVLKQLFNQRWRSEERRVGKECRSRWSAEH